jgi:hypothetical protein
LTVKPGFAPTATNKAVRERRMVDRRIVLEKAVIGNEGEVEVEV